MNLKFFVDLLLKYAASHQDQIEPLVFEVLDWAVVAGRQALADAVAQAKAPKA